MIGKSNVKILASLAGNSSRYRAQALVQEAIGSNPGFDAIFATNGYILNRTQPPQKVILIKPELLTKTTLPGG